MKLNNRPTNIVAACLLIFVFLVSIFSIKDDSLTMDELAHLPAGYSYLTQKDMRLNPEHPPLIKDLAGLPLLFIKNINFPSQIKSWQEDINGQWDFGNYFLFKSGNPAEKMIFWSRIPMLLILILLGFYIFKITKEFFGNKASLLSLFLFSFSPTLLAHGKLVTTDVGAATGALIATYYFFRALKLPSKKNIIFAGLAFGLAELFKFSLILLVPFFGFLTLVCWFKKSANLGQVVKILFSVFLIGFLLIWPVYFFHTWNYPQEKQISDTRTHLQNITDLVKKPIIFMAGNPALRPYAQYFTGLSMALQRVAGGNTTFFLGEVSNLGWRNYFPIVYLIKEPLAFHILVLIALFLGLKRIRRISFPVFGFLFFIALYWLVSIRGNLNIGVRHLLPVFPFTIILVSAAAVNLLKNPYLKIKVVALAGLIIWQAISVISAYPSFLAYFNESIGGPSQGYKYVVDSNLDWGQDLKRLKNWADEKGVDKIYLDYFGGSDTKYYLKEKYAPWWGDRNPTELPNGSYLAVSATFLQGGRGQPTPGFDSPTGFYNWLNKYQPVAQIGHSIFVYRID